MSQAGVQGALKNMSSMKTKLRLAGALAVLATLALAVSCRGFFVNPTLSTLAIGPTNLPLNPGQSYQMVATGTFNDGTTSNVTSKCIWSSTNASVATVGTNSGVVTAATNATTIGSTQISATDGAVASTTSATITVCPAVTNLTITANPASQAPSGQITLTATATVGGQGVDVTSDVTWNIGNTSVLTISGNIGTISSSATVGQSTTLSATLCNVSSKSITIQVN